MRHRIKAKRKYEIRLSIRVHQLGFSGGSSSSTTCVVTSPVCASKVKVEIAPTTCSSRPAFATASPQRRLYSDERTPSTRHLKECIESPWQCVLINGTAITRSCRYHNPPHKIVPYRKNVHTSRYDQRCRARITAKTPSQCHPRSTRDAKTE